MPTTKDIVLLVIAALLIGLFVGVMLPVPQAPAPAVTDQPKLVNA